MSIDLPLIWAGVIAFGIFMYVVMDGFDLGIGILYPFFRDKDERDAMMNTVAPIWDGNETWLVLGGAGLFAAFPLAYSVVLTALYIPLVVMLVALIFRGVAFEFRFKAKRTRHLWDAAFIWGSVLATFSQGVVLGAFIDGIRVEGRSFAGGPFDWLAPFPLFCGAGLVAGYAMLGCAWLLLKTEGKLRHKMYKLMLPLTCVLLLFIAAVSLWTPLAHPEIAKRWFTLPNLFYFMPVPTLVAVTTLGIVRAVNLKIDWQPFVLTLALIALAYAGLAISLWPNIIPPDISIWAASAPESSQAFTLVGVAIMVPVILLYTGYSYYVFRGKVKVGEGYH
ncbi:MULTISPECIES: cytochrome d ubiquinol oxidase subunit II [unclassified Pseudomonas]|uniref:cytochrome d ubiquinol oxidase subunit II n=1 Tax=unclassified Pseudomonas TaxID=196821 RepID=UPI002448B448|nr:MULTISPECIES: cytochrome d ubiquinol oxidase subunit II [unclassified Pseudomonas]MDG9930900.1 cytochrome d ubiquinol oxidase subunit II [Pseudomonas sp. GD04042]MDH0481032.1 cytochrome d ubiquinol oxidase subunit II [Pseudomonas sp. GD04015]MDH0604368.1 cytochrome d ubiquinol oxidase subunit II [Pseudomonas sp. GD03869]